MKFDVNLKKDFKVLGLIPKMLRTRTKFYVSWQALFRDTIKSKIGSVVEKSLQFVFRDRGGFQWVPLRVKY